MFDWGLLNLQSRLTRHFFRTELKILRAGKMGQYFKIERNTYKEVSKIMKEKDVLRFKAKK